MALKPPKPPTPPNAEDFLFSIPLSQIMSELQNQGKTTAGLSNNLGPEIVLTRTVTIGELDRFTGKHLQTVTKVTVDTSGDIHVYGVAF